MKPIFINLIVAVEKPGNGIGKKNGLLYSIADDMRHFVQTTQDSVVIMGKNTWLSLPKRPLAGRENAVVSSTLSAQDASGASVYPSWRQAVTGMHQQFPDKKIFIIGGGQLYADALPFAGKLYVTEIRGSRDPEIFFPDYSHWKKIREGEALVSKTGIHYRFCEFENPDRKNFQ